MSTQHTIEQKITRALNPLHLEVLNESHMHNVPPGSESHFKVTVVSEKFDGRMLVNRHRMVNEALAEELKGEIHALAMHTMTPEEWFEAGGGSADSPQCLGGSAAQNK
jgi:BolA protein